MSEREVWLWLSLDSIQMVSQLLGTLLSAAGFIGTMVILIAPIVSSFEERDFRYLWAYFLLPVTVIVFLLGLSTALIPNTKQYAVIKTLPKIVNSDFAKEATGDAKEMYQMAKDYMKEMMIADNKVTP